MIALATNDGFGLTSMDIRAAFLQVRIFDRDTYIRPPKYNKVEGYVWKLKKPLYGLNYVGQEFWLKLEDK